MDARRSRRNGDGLGAAGGRNVVHEAGRFIKNNVALAQAVVLRSIRMHVTIRNEPPARYRQLLRRVKFHRLVCEMEPVSAVHPLAAPAVVKGLR